MPKSPINYEKVMIYALRCKTQPGIVLYDYTTRPASRKWALKKRWATSTDDSAEFVREAGGWEAVDFFLVKPFPCRSGGEALMEANRLTYEPEGAANLVGAPEPV